MARCPCCGDHLLGFTFYEALKHLMVCDRQSGQRVLGIRPKYADTLYKDFTGDRIPSMDSRNRMNWYWKFAQDIEDYE